MNKEKLREKILGLSDLTTEEKTALLELINRKKKYGLVWEDKPEAVEEQLRDQIPVLKEVKELAIVNDPDTDKYPDHILIEGDNLHALTALSYTHEGKIDVIYIDPPYNTGNKDFVYNDSYVDKEDSYRHSKWLSFMEKRLKLAKRMLSDRGVIFISIDDNEQANLKLLCDQILGETNFIGSYFWKRTETPAALSYKIRKKLEFVIAYQKCNIPQRTFAQGYVDGGDAPLLNNGNPIGVLEFPENSVHFNIPDGVYSYKSGMKIKLINNIIVANGLNKNSFRAEANFKWGQRNLENEVSEGTYFLIKSNQFSIRYQKSTKSTKVPSNLIDSDINVGTNEEAQKEYNNFNINMDFSYSKPTSLLRFLIKAPFWSDPNIKILDFFAGSGTTLHATMQLNAEDGGNRQCILVTNNENNICTDVTYERNKRVIAGYTTPKGEEKAGLSENNLRYYKAEFVPRTKTLRNKRALLSAATDLLCIKEGNYAEKKMFGSIVCSQKGCRYFQQGKKQMLVIYDESLIAQIIDQLSTMEVEGKIKIYVFAPGMYPFTDDFLDVYDKIELCALPDAIYKAYQNALPKTARVAFLSEDAEDSMRQSERLLNSVPSSLFETLN